MPQSAAASFLAPCRVFTRGEYAAAVGRSPGDPALDAMLARHVRAGEIKHVAEDVFGAVPDGCKDPGKYPMPPFLVPAKLRPGAVLAYHAALDLHGYAYSITSCVTEAFSPAGAEEFVIDGRFYDFFAPAPGIVLGVDRPAAGIETVAFMGVDILVTTVERTLADLFACPAMGGEGLIESVEAIDSLHDLDAAALVRHARALGDEAAAGAMGFWLENRWNRRPKDDAAIRELRTLAPKAPRYALRAGPATANLPADGWNVIVPERFVEPEINGDRRSEM